MSLHIEECLILVPFRSISVAPSKSYDVRENFNERIGLPYPAVIFVRVNLIPSMAVLLLFSIISSSLPSVISERS